MCSEKYIENLRKEMIKKHCSEKFIEQCSEYSRNLLQNNLPVLFDEQHINIVLNIFEFLSDAGAINNSYHEFNISNGLKSRTITAPSVNLKNRQRWILDNILSKLPVSEFAYGFVNKKSIKTNALIHANNDYVICMDIKDFFPSIKQETIVSIFKNAGYTTSASKRLSQLCCYYEVLPQGAPTSPYLANLVCKKMDGELNQLANKFDSVYSRYADDMTFSSENDISEMISEITRIVELNGFLINNRKTIVFPKRNPKFITGLVVQNGSVRVPKKFKRELKKEIYFCKKYGVLNHLQNIEAKNFINYREHLYGKAYYIHMVEPEVGNYYLEQLDSISWPSWCL